MNISPNVIAALEAGRKIEAIKILREEAGIGLKEAKEAIDAYCEEHPEIVGSQVQYDSPAAKLKNQAILFVIILIAVAIYTLTR